MKIAPSVSPTLLALVALPLGCAGSALRPATPAGPPPAEAPPATDTEVTAPPQPDAPGTAPVVTERGKPLAMSMRKLPIVLASNPAPVMESTSGATITAAAPAPTTATPVMKRGPVEVRGEGLDRATVTRFLNKATASFLLCYQNAASTHPDIAGATTLTFEIDSEGKVSNADTSGGVGREVEQCVAGVATGIAFPRKSGAKAAVSYPIAFAMK